VGESTLTGLNDLHAFLWDSATGITDLGTLPDALDSRAYGLNNRGQIVGASYLPASSGSHAFSWSNGAMTDLNDDLPPDSGWILKSATGINEAGQVIGHGKNPKGQTHGFLLTPDGGSAPSGQTRLGSLAAQRWAAPSQRAPAVCEAALPGTHQPPTP